MPKKQKAILSIFLSLLIILFVTPTLIANPQPLFKIEVDGYYLTAGDENRIQISITNVGEDSAYNIKAILTVPQTVQGIAIVNGSYREFEEIEGGETKYMYPVLYVASGCPFGAYSLLFGLEYYDAPQGVVDREKFVANVQVGVIVDAIKPKEFVLRVDVDDYKVTAGSENEIGITLTNIGEETVYDVKATLTSTSPGIVVLKEQFHLFNTINKGEHVAFRPVLGVAKNTPLGAYSLTLTLNYEDSRGASYMDNLAVGILVDSIEPTERTSLAVQEFRITPSEIHPGDKFAVKMKIKNLGADAYDVRVQLATSGQSALVPLTPTLIFVGNIRSMDIAPEISYELRVNGEAKAQPYMLQLTISYYDIYGQPNSIVEGISVCVQSVASFKLLNVQPSNLTVEAGEMATVEADLVLIGTETVKFVQVQILQNYPFIALPESYEYIGRVDPDNPVPFDVQFMTDSNATIGSYKIQIKISYLDEYNQEHQVIKELPVVIKERIQKKGEASPSFWDAIRMIIRIVLGIKL